MKGRSNRDDGEGRSITMICFADVKSRAVLFLQKWLHWELNQVSPPKALRPAYDPLIEIMQDCCRKGDSTNDEEHKRWLRDELRGYIDQMRRDIACDRASLALFDTMEGLGIDPGCTRKQLIAELAEVQRRSLAFDMAWSDR
jgi:hypothetical protein